MSRKALMAAAAVIVVGSLSVVVGREYLSFSPVRTLPTASPAVGRTSAPVTPSAPRATDPAPSEARQPGAIRLDQVAKSESPEARRSVGGLQYGQAAMPEQEFYQPHWQPPGTADERYGDVVANPVKLVAEHPISTFSVDVDTAAYANVRRFLTDGVLPPVDAVRTEELVNYFPYDYPPPESAEAPFRADVALFDSPWDEGSQIIRIGLQGYDIPAAVRPPANLVFLVDTSGSMDSPDKLPLLKQSLRLLTEQMRPEDSVAIVAYAGSAGVVLEPTKGAERLKILAAIDAFAAGGSTAGAEGIRQAYALAEAAFRKEAVNRVVLATDGDFNVGITDPAQLEDFVARKRESGVYLSILGFGTGNLNDLLMQKLAQAGNGNAAYIDSLMEARKVLVEEMGSTVFTIADDVKVQIEFNPAAVAEYRLIGYETRLLNREDFNNDKVDAGDVGSGHSVTALYEVTPPDSASRLVDDLRYGGSVRPSAADGGELAFLRIRYKLPGAGESRLIEQPILASARTTFEAAPVDARFATAVAAFGQLLRNDSHVGGLTLADVHRMAQAARGADEFGYRSEFLRLVQVADSAAALETLN